ncbi:MAG TPA: histidine phosphatase family protein [Ktedonobacteraceae bacterium]
MTHLYVIRHAQPDGRKPEIIGLSPPDSGLSPLGVSQAQRLRDRLATTNDLHVDVLVSSPMLRAKETAEVLAPALGVPVLIDERVQGIRLGACEGLTWDEIGARFGHPETENEPFRRFAPDADSPASFAVRTCEGLDRLTRHYEGKTIVIVAHSETVEMTFRYFLGLPLFQQHLPVKFGCAPTAITYWRKGSKQWTLVQFNDHMHLPE